MALIHQTHSGSYRPSTLTASVRGPSRWKASLANDSSGSSSSPTSLNPSSAFLTHYGLTVDLQEHPAGIPGLDQADQPGHPTMARSPAPHRDPRSSCPLSLPSARPRQMSKCQGGIRPYDAFGDYTPFQQPMSGPSASGEEVQYPLPYLHSFSHELSGCTVFSRIDLVRAFHQIPIAEEDIPKTAVITPFGLFEFLRMPFGLRNAAQTLQRFINDVTRGLESLRLYLRHPHRQHLRSRPRPPSPRPLRQTARSGRRHQPGKMPVRCRFPLLPRPHRHPPRHHPSAREGHRYKEVPQASDRETAAEIPGHLLKPLHALITPNRASRNTKIELASPTNEAYEACKETLASATLLNHPLPEAPLSITVDASDTAIGPVLQQRQGKQWQLLAFFSQTLSPRQSRYSAFGREFLAAYSVVKHFQPFLEAKEFHILTDHKPLTFALHSRTRRQSPREERHLYYISQFTTDIRYIRGVDNEAADALSRVTISAATLTDDAVDYHLVSREQRQAASMTPLIEGQSSLNSERVRIPNSRDHLLCDVSLGYPAHTSRLPSVGDSSMPTTSTAASGPPNTSSAARSSGPPSTKMFGMGPLPMDDGLTYIVTMTDWFTRWPEATPIRDITAATVAKTFINTWVSRFGNPDTVTTDRGAQFESELWRHLMILLGSKRIRTTAYHPCAKSDSTAT
ncbi:putative choline/ethanolamine kinase [Penaeus vannamei]|uniref:Putative choline/ethanolamine kinase n=1 Tax=Penaeus vannamei TaxID=6689 RepID=A0A423TA21_PENVA|nr:putative choline/ethanolamine kinase [Penaeus vannamei]